MSKQYKKVVVVMRSQILHLGHRALLEKARQLGDEVFIFLGSANSPRTIANPFTYSERLEQLCLTINEMDWEGTSVSFHIYPLNDILDDNDAWLKQITDIIGPVKGDSNNPIMIPSDTAIVGGAKKEWYIPLFRKANYDHCQIHPYMAPSIQIGKGTNSGEVTELNATDLRMAYFTKFYDDANKIIKPLVPASVFEWLKEYRNTAFYGYMAAEYGEIKDRIAKFGKGPFFTCDNVIEIDGKILLVKRKNHPGKGLWAIPGGFLEIDETLQEGAYRELQEETNANISIKEFEHYCKKNMIFDEVKRSLYARILTSAYHIVLPNDFPLKTQAGDDAKETKLFTLEEIEKMHHLMYDDHYLIIKKMVGFKMTRFELDGKVYEYTEDQCKEMLDKIMRKGKYAPDPSIDPCPCGTQRCPFTYQDEGCPAQVAHERWKLENDN